MSKQAIHAPQLRVFNLEAKIALQREMNPQWWFDCDCGLSFEGTGPEPPWCPACQRNVTIKRHPVVLPARPPRTLTG